MPKLVAKLPKLREMYRDANNQIQFSKLNLYFTFATGNGGIPYHEEFWLFEEGMSEEDIEEFLEGRHGPFTSGHRGFKLKRLSIDQNTLDADGGPCIDNNYKNSPLYQKGFEDAMAQIKEDVLRARNNFNEVVNKLFGNKL